MTDEKDLSTNQGDRRPARRDSAGFRNVFDRLFDEDFWLEPRDFLRSAFRAFPKVDVSETDAEVKVVADIPGVDPDKIDIDVRENRMKIRGSVEREAESDGERPYRYERSYGEFRREFMLPARVKEDDVRATYKEGVLTITAPKVEEERSRRIRIEKQ